jgi:MFS family permease
VAPLSFFLASFVWNYGLGMTYVVVPLYAHSQGLTGTEIGVLFSIPVLGQVAVNLLGGAYTDRVGGRFIMLVSAWLMAAAPIEFVLAQGFWTLFAGQLVMVLSRAAFWPATWSLASELPGVRGVQMGRLNAVTNLGQIAGTGSCGFILASSGFVWTFLVLSGMGLAAWLFGLLTPRATRKPKHGPSALGRYRALLRLPIIYYAMACAYVSALPFSLSMSFYPLLLSYYGFGEDSSGILIALRAVGAISAGLLAARFVNTGPASAWPVYSALVVAVAVGALPLFPSSAMIATLMLLVGVGSGLMTLYFQLTISDASTAQERGSAMALGGLGWGISHLTTPLVMGLLADRYGIVTGFYALGVLALACAGGLALGRRRAFAAARAVDAAPAQ